MSLLRSAFSGLIAVSLLSTGAFASMSAQEAWDFARAVNADYGVVMQAARQDATDGGLVLHDVTYSMPLPGGTLAGTVPRISLTEIEEGRVSITLSDSYSMQLMVQPEGAPTPMTADITVAIPGLNIVLDGTPQAATMAYFAPSITLRLDALESQGQRIALDAVIDVEALDMTYKVSRADMRETVSEGTVAAAGFTLSLEKPSGNGRFEADGAFVDIGFSGTGSSGTAPLDLTTDTIAELLRQGLASDASVSHAGSDLSYTVVDGTAIAAGRVTSDSGRLDMSLSQDGLNYAGATDALDVTFESSELPTPPLSGQVESLEFMVGLPVQKSDVPADVDLLIDMAALTLSDPIWQMFDPTGALPRDPATLVVDLGAKANWFTDILGSGAATLLGGTSKTASGADSGPSAPGTGPDTLPGQIHALDIRQIKLEAAGADLNGSGKFTFDNSTPSPFGPGPKPQGRADVRIDGVNALLRNLTQMGLLQQQQAMMAQMTLGLFGRTVEGQDAVTSTIEITPEGALMANGQRLQ